MSEYFTYRSPIGFLHVEIENQQLTAIHFEEQNTPNELANTKLGQEISKQLDEYFAGKLFRFDLPLNPKGTDFQKKVWVELNKIEFGEHINYGELALRLSNKKLIRAVGGANSKNPIPIIIPCHRVIGANNKLVGYAGGIWRKKWLLQHELTYHQSSYTLF